MAVQPGENNIFYKKSLVISSSEFDPCSKATIFSIIFWLRKRNPQEELPACSNVPNVTFQKPLT